MALKLLPNDGSGADEADAEILSEINITPLVDVVLVLLIIFMVGSSVMSQLGVDVDLPEASPAVAQEQPDGVVITLLTGGAVRIADLTVPAGDWPRFEAGLQAAFKATPSRLVILEGDRKAFLGSVIELMDRARGAGAEKFALAAQSAPER
ncbi:MAG: biopolymer transporter ExbD [Bdellovibrionales bacterium]|nr:biopolymer transporter ExbD [Bdellovibrionales bacterium]